MIVVNHGINFSSYAQGILCPIPMFIYIFTCRLLKDG